MVEKKYTKIYFRLLPSEKMIWDYLKILDDHKTIYIRCLQELNKSKENVIPTFWTFHSDHVFFNDTQKEIYNNIIPDVLENVSSGCDAIIMSYGQTGTGKSLTTTGLLNPFENRGILPRIVTDLFEMMRKETTKHKIKMCLQASYVEFSRTNIYDLLQPYPNLITSLKNLTKTKIRNEEEALKIIFRGEGRKIFAQDANYPSHASSSIFTFCINTKNSEMQDNAVTRCKLHIIDLAGADTVGNFSCLFKNPYEVGAANLTKTQLEQFFLVLCSNIPEQIRIKQRINPMIQYLGDSLNKTSILRLIGHIRASREDLLVTISMLRFGELIGGLKSLRCEVNINKDVTEERVISLEKELSKLKLERTYNKILMEQDLTKSLSEERLAHIERTVNEFLQNKITQLSLLNVCDINIALEIIKMVYNKSGSEKEKEKEEPVMIKHKSSASHPKVPSRSSRASAKLSTGDLQKERPTRSAASIKIQRDTESKSISRTSSSVLVKRSSTSKRRSISSTQSREKSRQSLDHFLMPQLPPEYPEAWSLYITEKHEDYIRLQKNYEVHETEAKNLYRVYLDGLDKLREISGRVEKHKHDLFLVRMTREFQHSNIDHGQMDVSEFEKCSSTQLQKAQQEHLEMQESVLKCQAELKAYINVCKDIKNEVKQQFDLFCKEKYQVEVSGLKPSESAKDTMDIIATLKEEDEKVIAVEFPEDNKMTEDQRFERYKNLIEYEKRRKKLYQMRHRGWVVH